MQGIFFESFIKQNQEKKGLILLNNIIKIILFWFDGKLKQRQMIQIFVFEWIFNFIWF